MQLFELVNGSTKKDRVCPLLPSPFQLNSSHVQLPRNIPCTIRAGVNPVPFDNVSLTLPNQVLNSKDVPNTPRAPFEPQYSRCYDLMNLPAARWPSNGLLVVSTFGSRYETISKPERRVPLPLDRCPSSFSCSPLWPSSGVLLRTYVVLL